MSVDKKLRVGVVGVGNMGKNHVRIYGTMNNCELIGVYDADINAAKEVAERVGCKCFDTMDALAAEVDAVSVAAPSSLHGEIGSFFLEKGIHTLMEKPLAVTVEEGNALLAAAKKGNAKLMVGYVERFNPAVQQLLDILEGRKARINAISTRRLSAASSRIADVSVVQDLLVHDLDIILAIMGRAPSTVNAMGISKSSSHGKDYVQAQMEFVGDNHTIVSATASRITQNRIRELEVDTDIGIFYVNYFTQELKVLRQRGAVDETDPLSGFGLATLDIASEQVFVRRSEPLVTELNHFVDAVLNDTEIEVSGEQGLKIMQLAIDIDEKCKS